MRLLGAPNLTDDVIRFQTSSRDVIVHHNPMVVKQGEIRIKPSHGHLLTSRENQRSQILASLKFGRSKLEFTRGTSLDCWKGFLG